MARRRLLWKLYPAYVGVVVACTVLVGTYVLGVVRAFHLDRTEHDLLSRARLVAAELERLDGDPAAIDPLVDRWAGAADMRLTVIAADGRVLGDSHGDPATMDDHSTRPEVREALARGEASSLRDSATLHDESLYAAVRGGPGVVRAALATRDVERSLDAVRVALLLGGGVLVLAAAALGLVHARTLTAPLRSVRDAAERFAGGDLSRRVPVPDTEEAAVLADSLNRMAAQLQERLATIERQADEQGAVLRSMTEGVVAVDQRATILSTNPAAARLLGVDAQAVAGRRLTEVVRNAELDRLATAVLETGEPAVAEIALRDPGDPEQADRLVQVHASVLRGEGGRHGAVLVMDDVTRLRQLESVRREFVANVSHELKTPVTSIQGFIETLRDGAWRDPERAERFLAILARQAERLSAIIEDLLTLSRLEREGGDAGIPLGEAQVREVLAAAVQACEPRARERGVAVSLGCEPGLRWRLNPPLVEQAVVNLVDNAVKHSEAGAAVDVSAARVADGLVIEVRDRGCGIEREHLPRIFERFYRVDRARSRKAGGTGLGLSIVKHIAQAHGGSVSVDSEPGRGSTFRITLPDA